LKEKNKKAALREKINNSVGNKLPTLPLPPQAVESR